MSETSLPAPCAPAHAGLPGPQPDLHWTQKRRPQQSRCTPIRRVRPEHRPPPAFFAAVAAAADARVEEHASTRQAPDGALRADRVGRLELAAPLAQLPAVVRKGQLLGHISALALNWPVTSPADGVVKAVLAADGAPVGYGQPVFDFEATAPGLLAA